MTFSFSYANPFFFFFLNKVLQLEIFPVSYWSARKYIFEANSKSLSFHFYLLNS